MVNDTQIDGYFKWLCCRVSDPQGDPRYDLTNYSKLLYKLFTTPFFAFVEHDENRASDGVSLRYRYSPEFKSNYISPCSMLEMMIALCDRIDAIVDCPIYNSRMYVWFWMMLDNSGLDGMNDILYDEGYVHKVLYRIIYRQYEPNGKGGLFYVPNARGDFRQIELWYQMQQAVHVMLS